jgi:UDP:flavonoid glycosyltransferase YjiC (YdhE family)
MAHFALTTFGSLGDLHPYIAVGLGLRDRGHRVTIATSEVYRSKVEGEGLGFHPVRPNLAELRGDAEFLARALHPRKGTEYIFRHLMVPWIEHSYSDLKEIAVEADLLVGHPIAFATPIVAEQLRKPWISVVLQPIAMLSAFDAPSVSGAPFLEWFRGFGPGFWRQFGRAARAVLRSWSRPVNELRKRAGLPAVANPLLDGMFSPFGTQAWFSEVLAQPQPDWPPKTLITGFSFYDRLAPGEGLSAELRSFLDAGPPPVVFTLGSSAVFDAAAGDFFEESLSAVRRLGCRAVLLIGDDANYRPSRELPGVLAAPYAPYSELFPRAAAVVQSGGVGTTAQTLRAGVPMCMVPWSHDQPDNARRCANLGVARVVPRGKYRASRVAAEIERLLTDASFHDAAARVAAVIAREDGVARACDGLESAVR